MYVLCRYNQACRVENLAAAIWPYFAHYNFVRVHISLRVAPGMAAGVTDDVWTTDKLLNAGAI
jgi:hypothetical protein